MYPKLRLISLPGASGKAEAFVAGGGGGGGTTPDPMLLPAANGQPTDFAAYVALNVAAMTPGQSYLDPVTGVTVVKLTTPSSPVVSAGSYASAVDYASGGCRIGRPTGDVYPIAIQVKVETSVEYHIMTFNLVTHAVGYRSVSPGTGSAEIAKAMSLVTPNVMYAFTGSTLRKYDISGGAPAEITGGVWPKDFSGNLHAQTRFTWIQSTADDRYFAFQAGDAGPWVIVWDSQTNTIYEHQFASDPVTSKTFNEFKLDKAGPFVHSTGQVKVWDAVNNVESNMNSVNGYYSHNDTLRRYAFGFDADSGQNFWRADLESTPASLVSIDTSYYIDNLYTSGGWVDQASDLTQWALLGYQPGGGTPDTSKIRRTGLALERLNGSGGPRLLCHSYGLGNVNATPDYYHNSLWPNMAPDGRFCLFKSNMNSLGGFASMFAAILPTS